MLQNFLLVRLVNDILSVMNDDKAKYAFFIMTSYAGTHNMLRATTKLHAINSFFGTVNLF